MIPTYHPLPPDKNPMFLEKRVYQGSSGRVYPSKRFPKIVRWEICRHVVSVVDWLSGCPVVRRDGLPLLCSDIRSGPDIAASPPETNKRAPDT